VRRVLVLVVVAVLAAGCGGGNGGGNAKNSQGFRAAHQPPPAAETGVKTSQVTPQRRKYVYPRALARRIVTSCVRSGGSTRLCGCVIKRLENTVAPSGLSAARATAARRRCQKSGSG
jgi:hypothetical protein